MKAICRLSSLSTLLALRMPVVVVSRQNTAVDVNKRKKLPQRRKTTVTWMERRVKWQEKDR